MSIKKPEKCLKRVHAHMFNVVDRLIATINLPARKGFKELKSQLASAYLLIK
jgi:hypothetical protein